MERELLTESLKACDCWAAYDQALFNVVYQKTKAGSAPDAVRSQNLDQLYSAAVKQLRTVQELRRRHAKQQEGT